MEVREVSEALGVSEDELVRRGVKAYLEVEVRRVRAEIFGILSRYGVASLRGFDERMSGGEFSETETFEDFTRLDYLGSSHGRILLCSFRRSPIVLSSP